MRPDWSDECNWITGSETIAENPKLCMLPTDSHILGEQSWHSGESTCLQPMWPGFDSELGPYVG